MFFRECVSQRRTVLSALAVAMVLPSGRKATQKTMSVWPVSVPMCSYVAGSQRRTVLSSLALASVFPSGLKARALIAYVCPLRVARVGRSEVSDGPAFHAQTPPAAPIRAAAPAKRTLRRLVVRDGVVGGEGRWTRPTAAVSGRGAGGASGRVGACGARGWATGAERVVSRWSRFGSAGLLRGGSAGRGISASRPTSAAAVGRSLGFLDISSCSRGVSSPACEGGARGLLRMAWKRATKPDPPKGAWPSTAVYNVAPRDHRSPGAAASAPSSCSGGMYCGVPTTIPVPVRRVPAEPSSTRAIPKSVMTVRRPTVSTLSGFRSRCTTPDAWACASASAMVAASATTCGHGRRPSRSIRPASDSPATSSMTIQGSPPSLTTS